MNNNDSIVINKFKQYRSTAIVVYFFFFLDQNIACGYSVATVYVLGKERER